MNRHIADYTRDMQVFGSAEFGDGATTDTANARLKARSSKLIRDLLAELREGQTIACITFGADGLSRLDSFPRSGDGHTQDTMDSIARLLPDFVILLHSSEDLKAVRLAMSLLDMVHVESAPGTLVATSDFMAENCLMSARLRGMDVAKMRWRADA